MKCYLILLLADCILLYIMVRMIVLGSVRSSCFSVGVQKRGLLSVHSW